MTAICRSFMIAILGTLLFGLSHANAQVTCPETVTLTAALSGTTITEQASQSLTASNEVSSGTVTYQAGQSVLLTAGFVAKSTAVFVAKIGECISPGSRLAAEEETTPEDDKTISLAAYPNPFRNNTVIEYFLPASTRVSLVVYDVRGRELTKLLRDQQQAEGVHRVTFESGVLSSGVYICTLNTGTDRRVVKIIKE